MILRRCYVCKDSKSVSEFGKNKSMRDGINHTCKECSSALNREYRKTKTGVISRLYNHQKINSRRRGMAPPEYTFEEFKSWVVSQPEFHVLHKKWEISEFDPELKPSTDRINDYLPYSLDNIRVVTWGENSRRANQDRVDGVNNKKSRAIEMLDVSGRVLCNFYSAAQAARTLGCHASGIRAAAAGKQKTSHGYRWRFVGGSGENIT